MFIPLIRGLNDEKVTNVEAPADKLDIIILLVKVLAPVTFKLTGILVLVIALLFLIMAFIR